MTRKPIEEFPGYYVSDEGEVFSEVNNNGGMGTMHKLQPLRATYIRRGLVRKKVRYEEPRYVVMYKDHKRYNRSILLLVANAFIPNPNGYRCVTLINPLDKENYSVSNLQWVPSNHCRLKCIVQLDADHRVVGRHALVIDAAKAVNGNHSNISHALQSAYPRNHAYGYYWGRISKEEAMKYDDRGSEGNDDARSD